jgi:hypothetical protein
MTIHLLFNRSDEKLRQQFSLMLSPQRTKFYTNSILKFSTACTFHRMVGQDSTYGDERWGSVRY